MSAGSLVGIPSSGSAATKNLWNARSKEEPVSNGPMQALFAKVGFKRSGRIDNLDPNDPEIVYYRSVKGEGSEGK